MVCIRPLTQGDYEDKGFLRWFVVHFQGSSDLEVLIEGRGKFLFVSELQISGDIVSC